MNDSGCNENLVSKSHCNVINSLTTFPKCNYKYKRRVHHISDVMNKNIVQNAPAFCLFVKFMEETEKKHKMIENMCNDDVNKHQQNYNNVSTLSLDNNNKNIDCHINSKKLATNIGDCAAACIACCARQAWQHSQTIPTTTTSTFTCTSTSTRKITNDMSLSQHSRQISSLATTLSMSTRRLSFNWIATAPTTKSIKNPTSPAARCKKMTTSSVNLLSILMMLFIALVWSARGVQGRFTFICTLLLNVKSKAK